MLVPVLLVGGLLAPQGAGAEAPPGTGLDRATEVSKSHAGPKPKKAVKAGVARVDASWHVGASAGQYASDGTSVGDHGVDPSHHSTRRSSSYGIQSRSEVRALVVEGTDGRRVAIVANDLYIPQDLVNRRVGTILEQRDQRIRLGLEQGHLTGITEANMVVSVSHSHSSPYYSTPSWGVWAFQDVFDLRFFEYMAQRMAGAVVGATEELVPVRMGGATVPFAAIQRHSYGPTVGDDGTPAGYPETDNDKTVAVLRFDDISGETPEPLANWVVFGLHPEMLDGNDLLTGEYVHTMYRFVDREVGGMTLFSQNNTGTAEPAREARAHAPAERAEYSHKEYAQMERAARLLADAVEHGRDVAGGAVAPAPGEIAVPFRDRFEVGIKDLRLAPPSLRLLPVVSSCRAEQLFHGNPPVPIAGLPDCVFPLEEAGVELPFDPGVTYDTLRQAGVPVPDNIGAPSYTGLQETVQVHLQALRLGDIGVTVCPCEQWADQSRNIKSRLDGVSGNLWLGFDWTRQTRPDGQPWCVQNPDTTWTCGNPNTRGATTLPPVADRDHRRMVAQVGNNACSGPANTNCWDEPANSLQAETDPWEPDDIWGNFIHEELTKHAYDMVVTVGMSNDYWGYIASYREFQRGDHYRKALTGLGPHSMDFLATRLSRMAAELNGGDEVRLGAKDVLYSAENQHQRNRARAIGEAAAQLVPLYEKTLPADGGTPAITSQPAANLERFGAARVAWVGGSNWFDLPAVKVQRLDGGTWRDFGDMTGEVQAMVHYPQANVDVVAWRAGQFPWVWEATYEVFSSDVALSDPRGSAYDATPPGDYRFVVEGVRHEGLGARAAYKLVSQPFEVAPWSGIRVTDLTADAATDTVTFRVSGEDVLDALVGPIDYPDSYASPFRFIEGGKDVVVYAGGHREEFCFECSFRPWADAGTVASAVVTVGGVTYAATCDGDGLCVAAVPLEAGDTVAVGAGAVTDRFGNLNGQGASTAAG